MELTTLAMLVVIVGVASCLQTLTGFAFALVFMGAIAVTGAVGIEDGALIVTLLMLVNATLILIFERRFVSKASLVRIVPPALVGTVAGTRRWPPPLSAAAMRSLTVLLLILTGLFLAVPPIVDLIGQAGTAGALLSLS